MCTFRCLAAKEGRPVREGGGDPLMVEKSHGLIAAPQGNEGGPPRICREADRPPRGERGIFRGPEMLQSRSV